MSLKYTDAFSEQLEERGLKQFKIITENENYGIWARDKDDAEVQVIDMWFRDVLDDDLPDKLAEIEIVEL